MYLKLHPYKQKSLAQRKNIHFYGPFVVVRKIGEVGYELKLPATVAIHLVFHVSLLKKAVGDAAVISSKLLELEGNGMIKHLPIAILARRFINKDNQTLTQTQWAHKSEADASWEDWQPFKEQFLEFKDA